MLNQVIIVGRIQKISKNDKITYINVAVPRSYKNDDGEYETDIIYVKTNIENDMMKENSLIGIKGKLENYYGDIILVAEKITLLKV